MTFSCAELTHDHEGGGVVRPALSDVWALSFFAHGVELESLNDLLRLKVLRRARSSYLKP